MQDKAMTTISARTPDAVIAGTAPWSAVRNRRAAGVRLPAWLLLGVALTAALPAHGQGETAPSAVFAGSRAPSVHRSQVPSRLRGTGSGAAQRIVLPPPTAGEKASAQPKSADTIPVPPRIGFGRDLALLLGSAPDADDLVWEDLANGGQVASLVIVSPGALALRVQLELPHAPRGLEVRFYDPDGPVEEVGPVPHSELIGYGGRASTAYWSPTVAGDAIAIELYLPPGVTPKLKLIVRRISHLEANPLALHGVGNANCRHVDVACQPDSVSAYARNSVAKYTFTTSSGQSSNCTGTLLNDLDGTTQAPYFLTAHHCVGNQAEASSMELYWFFERAECGGAAPETVTRQKGGAVLLSSQSLDDGGTDVTVRARRDGWAVMAEKRPKQEGFHPQQSKHHANTERLRSG